MIKMPLTIAELWAKLEALTQTVRTELGVRKQDTKKPQE